MSNDPPTQEPATDATPPPEAASAPPSDASDSAASAETAPAPSDKPKPGRHRQAVRLAFAFVGFAAGFIIGPYAEELLARANPSFFGPDNQQVIDEQKANFQAFEDTLAQLQRAVPDDPATTGLVARMTDLLAEQKALAERKDQMFKEVDVQKQSLTAELLRVQGNSSAVGFWIKPGESVTLRDPNLAFSISAVYTLADDLQANLSGEKTRVAVGDVIEFDTPLGGKGRVIYRHGRRKSDGRYGFDAVYGE